MLCFLKIISNFKNMGETNEFPDDSYSSSTSLGVLSRSSEGTSSSSSDLADDASSSPTNTITFSPNSSSNDSDCGGGGPLCELSELMTHLPIKRGLSWHYAGKSQSFTSLASARNLEDLMKKENPCPKRMKLCSRRTTSFGPNMVAKAVMSERRSSFLGTTTSSSSLGKRCASINSRPPIPVVRTF